MKLVLLIGTVITALMVVDVAWNVQIQRKQSAVEAHEKAEVLAEEMHAVWRFIDVNQDNVNRNDDGTFRNMQLVCVVAAKSVSALFTRETDYSIRFVSTSPRHAANAADAFEAEALAAFGADRGLQSFSRIEADKDGGRVFRYAEPLEVTEACLECHGEPAGEPDQYGYAKEGMAVGDTAGAISITEPMVIYDSSVFQSVVRQLFMVALTLVVASAAIFIGVNAIVLRPLDRLRGAAKQIRSGDFGYSLELRQPGRPDEMTEFAADFDTMARWLKDLCEDLEGQVRLQTERLVALNQVLVEQQGMLQDALERLNDEIESKNDFFAVVSHELRTPLTSILAYARMLDGSPHLDEKTRHGIKEIEANGTVLLNLVNNILTISKTEANKNDVILEPIDFVDLVGYIKNALEPLARNKQVCLTAAVSPDVPVCLADWEKLRRIVENLVDNAIKYTHPAGAVNVAVSYDPERDVLHKDGCGKRVDEGLRALKARGVVVIEVSDNGVGIDEEDLEAIFERYRQTRRQSSNHRYKGTGLGLAVVKELAELHGGAVSVRSVRQQGSTFTVIIPCFPVETEGLDEDPAC